MKSEELRSGAVMITIEEDKDRYAIYRKVRGKVICTLEPLWFMPGEKQQAIRLAKDLLQIKKRKSAANTPKPDLRGAFIERSCKDR
jgi:hypothetical protein